MSTEGAKSARSARRVLDPVPPLDAPPPQAPAALAGNIPDNLTMIVGAPRSGTSWLAKIFDSHPSVLYRHEPDTILREPRIPTVVRNEDADRYLELARDYLSRLIATRSLKAVGSLPIFEKEFRRPSRQVLHKGLICGLHALNFLTGGPEIVQRVPISDLDDDYRPPPRVVIKSVSLRGRIGLITRAAPKTRMILVVRHPCGQIASVLRGHRLGKFRHDLKLDELTQVAQISRFSLSEKDLVARTPIEQYAWHWALLYQKAIDDLRDNINAAIVHYEELCVRPAEITQKLFAFAELPWTQKTEDFIAASTNNSRRPRYFGVFRDSKRTAGQWRNELSLADQDRIVAITRQFEVGRLTLD